MTVQYLIDSENVGDFWIPLLDLPGQDTELIVFYTRNSPHMSYDSLIKLKESDRTVTFIKCYEGTNALDFQLVSELGYRISKEEDGSFIIVTNDTGFDAAVKYWRRRKKSVKRITGKECKNLERRMREDLLRGIPQTHSSNVSGRLLTQEEHDEEQDVQTEEIRTETEAEQEARPSRPNLRDAEQAAQPDPDDSSMEENGYPEDADFDDEEPDDEDSLTFDLFVEDTDDPSFENEEDDLQDDDAFDLESRENGAETPDVSEAEDEADAENDEEMSAESAADFRDTLTEVTEDPAQDSVFTGESSTEEDSSENGSGPAQSEQDGVGVEEQAQDENDPAGPEADASVMAEQEISANLPESPASPCVEQDDSSVDNDSKPAAAGETPAEADDHTADSQETAEADVNPSASEEEAVSETAHRSKSRRSRSRRSKSTARKQEQTADDTQTHDSSGQGTAASAAGNDNRKSDAAKDDKETAAGNPTDTLPEPGDEEIARIVACIGPENLAELHNQLATFYGEQGKEIYLSIKNNSRSLPVLKPDLKQKFEYYCEIIFYRSDYSGEYPSDISEYLLNVREKLNNLNSLRYALQKHYGKEKGRRFYFLLKPFAKTMYQM